MDPDLLNSWKEIAAYMGRGVRTVQRWERDLALPVRRLGKERTIVAPRSEKLIAGCMALHREAICE